MTDPNIYPEGKVTGYFGSLTKKAVLRFQDQYDLGITGFVDLDTREKLNEIYFEELCPKSYKAYPNYMWVRISRTEGILASYVPYNLIDISDKIKTISIICLQASVTPFL